MKGWTVEICESKRRRREAKRRRGGYGIGII
jgi:hypothetical protein